MLQPWPMASPSEPPEPSQVAGVVPAPEPSLALLRRSDYRLVRTLLSLFMTGFLLLDAVVPIGVVASGAAAAVVPTPSARAHRTLNSVAWLRRIRSVAAHATAR